ncbi:hypothetical protein MY4038_004924 [Beauveria bassiana]
MVMRGVSATPYSGKKGITALVFVGLEDLQDGAAEEDGTAGEMVGHGAKGPGDGKTCLEDEFVVDDAGVAGKDKDAWRAMHASNE